MMIDYACCWQRKTHTTLNCDTNKPNSTPQHTQQQLPKNNPNTKQTQSYRAKLLGYLRQIAVITPYAQFSFSYVGEDERSSLRLVFRRRTDVMPPAPQVA